MANEFILFDGQLVSKNFIQKIGKDVAQDYKDHIDFYVYISNIDDGFENCYLCEEFDIEEDRDARFEELVKLLGTIDK